MRKTAKHGKVRTALVCAAMAAGVGVAAPAAFADTKYPYGGTWNYGVESGWVYSNFYYKWGCHASSVKGSWYQYNQAGGGVWSQASAASRWYATDKSYYSKC